MADAEEKTARAIPYQVFLFCLSVYVLIALMAEVILPLSSEVIEILSGVDNLVCFIFLIDFSVRLFSAPSKLGYLRWGWIDLISSIPLLDFLRWGRAYRLIRLIRVLRTLKSIRVVLKGCLHLKSHSAFFAALLASILMLVVGSIWVYFFESEGNGNLQTGSDALWWSVTTMTTVGYGDYYPVTTGGRIVASALMVTGVGLFGSFTGFLASWLVEDDLAEDQRQLDQIQKEIVEVRKMLDELVAKSTAGNNVQE